MNEQLPPVDAGLREQLSRRTEGRLPADLLEDVLSAVDSTPSAPVVHLASIRRNPRVSGALVGLAAVVVLVATLVAVPALQNAPAATSYSTDRALTAAELAAVMSGPALQLNTALVAEVTIRSNPDVCPMDRYPTLGTIEGMPTQVCVMISSATYQLPPSQTGSGVFAFRYLAPGVLGLLGKITTAPSGLAFKATDEWPLQGKTFVVDGWLGAEETTASCAYSPEAGDVLSPSGPDCPYDDWLGAETYAPSIAADHVGRNGVSPSYDPLSLRGNARHVQAGGMRLIDAVPHLQSLPETPIHGRYVVKSQVGACAGASPASSEGCGYWLVLAKLSDALGVPQPTPTATPVTTPTTTIPAINPSTAPQTPSGYPTDRALTTAELGRLLDSGSLKELDTVVVDAQVQAGPGTCPIADAFYPINVVGTIAGLSPAPCVYSGGAPVAPGHLILRYGGDAMGRGSLLYLGTAAAQSATPPLAYSADGIWPRSGEDFLVEGWLTGLPHSCPSAASPTPGQNPLKPDPDLCSWQRLTSASSPMLKAPEGNQTGLVSVSSELLGSIDDFSAPVHGTYVVRAPASPCVSYSNGAAGTCGYLVLARLAEVAVPTATPVPALPDTPVPEPTTASDSSYPGMRPMMASELDRYLKTAAAIKDKVVVVEASFTQTNSCAGHPGYVPIGLLAGMSSDICVVGIGDGKAEHSPASASGVFAFRVLDSNTLGFMANVTAAAPTQLAYTPAQTWPAGDTILVSGWLSASSGIYMCPNEGGLTAEALDPGGTSCGPTWLSAQEAAGPLASPPPTDASGFQQVAVPDYPVLGGNLLGTDGAAAHGTYLVRDEKQCGWTFPSPDPGENNTWDKLCGWQIMARVDPVELPQATPTPSPSASPTVTAQSVPGLWGSGDRPLTVTELMSLWRAGKLAGREVVTKGPVETCPGVIFEGSPCSPLIVGEGDWVLKFDAASKPTVVGQLKSTSSTFVSTVDGVKAASTLKPGDIVAVDGLLEFWLNFCDIQRVGGCSPSWLVRPDGNIRSSIEVQEGDYAAFASASIWSTAKVRGVYLVLVGQGNSPWTTLARLESASPATP